MATDYDRATASWSYGKYFSDLGCAYEAADPEIIADASVRWVKEDIREKLKAQGIAPTEFNVQSVIMGDSRLWERPLDRDFRDNMIASGNDDLDARVTILKENGNFKNVDTAMPVESLDDLEQYRSDRLTDKVTSLKDSLDAIFAITNHLFRITGGADAVGAGDRRLVPAIATACGFHGTVYGMGAMCIAMLANYIPRYRAKEITLKSRVPMGPFLLVWLCTGVPLGCIM